MRTYIAYGTVLLLTLAAAAAHAGSVVLHPSRATAIRSSAVAPPSACALAFDLSQVPDSAQIDLAELRLTLDVDTTLGEAVSVFLGVVTEPWAGGLVRTTPVTTSDSLFASGALEPGQNRAVEFNLTDLVTLWHTGQVVNHGLVLSVPGNVLRQVALAGSPQTAVTLTVFYSK